MANKKKGNQLENEELSAEDFAIIAAGLSALGEVFAFWSLIKAREVTEQTGGEDAVLPTAFVQSRKKAKRKKT